MLIDSAGREVADLAKSGEWRSNSQCLSEAKARAPHKRMLLIE
jgi:hypothetical protein